MDHKGYTLNREGLKDKGCGRKLYRREELELMTTFQMREICRTEKIIQGIINPLDKEELLHIILRYRGVKESRIIREYREDGLERIETAIRTGRILLQEDNGLRTASKIAVYEGLELSYTDGITLPYREKLNGTNAFVVGGGRICGIFHIGSMGRTDDCLYLLKERDMPCREAEVRDYSLYCFAEKASDYLYRLYYGEAETEETVMGWKLPLIDFERKQPAELNLPAAVDFGSTNTTAGVYLDQTYFEQTGRGGSAEERLNGCIKYTVFYEETEEGIEERTLLPSVVGVKAIADGRPEYVFGYDALRLANLSYIDEGFCVFYDIKHWIGDYEKEEEITDREGKRLYVKRKEILKAFFRYVIDRTEDCFKCKVKQLHISCPVKQKYLFNRLFSDILPAYALPMEEVLDEGVAVLYNTISSMIEKRNFEDAQAYEALIIDCGGGTTDLCACRFRIWDKRISYRIEIETSYENGDTDFGGNNLTYRIMQYMKLVLAGSCGYSGIPDQETVLRCFDTDIYRFVDENGAAKLYEPFEQLYESAERYIPTRFREYESRGREDYFKVKNNFYYLFFLAERMKKLFFDCADIQQVTVGSGGADGKGGVFLRADKWKLAVVKDGQLSVCKEFPDMEFGLFSVELLLKGDIYGIIRKFMEPLYLADRMKQFAFLKLTGQSCKIGIFRSALKEFIPGRMIQFRRNGKNQSQDYGLKMTCIDGALNYIRDKKSGFSEVIIHTNKPVLPYTVYAYTHNGQEVELINGFLRDDRTRTISRNLDDVTLQLFLKDTDGNIRYSFHYDCSRESFEKVTFEDISRIYGDCIEQKETDSIINHEMKFFVWKKCEEWGYVIVPVYREEESLYLGKEKFYSFENEGWVQNFFDGEK